MKTFIGVIDHEIWQEVRPYAYLEYYSGQPLKNLEDRKRRKVTSHVPKDLKERMMKVKVNCCSCLKLIHPFREGMGSIDIMVSCPLEKSVACSRRKAPFRGKMYSTIQCERIEQDLQGRSVPLDPRQEEMNL